METFLDKIKENNKTHVVNKEELSPLLEKANLTFKKNFSNQVNFERSVFINWTCAIADCQYCYLSTKPKYNPAEGTTALRSKESILAEIIICKAMGWDIGYITGGLRVESTEQIIELLKKINIINGKKIMMNFGPYSRNVIEKFSPYVTGMGSAIESFDEELHNFICPSKPLKSLLSFLENLQDLKLEKLITIILGLGEKKEDVNIVIANIKKYNIEKIQLCFLKPQQGTIFNDVPSPNMNYMAFWAAKIRIACPNIIIKVALVKERIEDFSLLLKAGVNGFSRFLVFKDFASDFAFKLEKECLKAERELVGNFTKLPDINVKQLIDELPFEEELKNNILEKAEQYYEKLKKL